jgi:predicted nucleic acid-binding protein
MNSLDTNILYYATNTSCPEHPKARALLERVSREPLEWIVADQVLYEYYRLVRNPAVLSKPLDAAEASRRLRFFREELGCLHCAYEKTYWDGIFAALSAPHFPARCIFDLVLAVTLQRNHVDTLYTRNTTDFDNLGLFKVINPLV